MAAIYSNAGIFLASNFTKRDALSSVYKISMRLMHCNGYRIHTYTVPPYLVIDKTVADKTPVVSQFYWEQ
jgi:hypothetical protein